MFKRYDDASHWGLFIPIGRVKLLKLYFPSEDEVVKGFYRMHFCITVKIAKLTILTEIRIRFGKQYLPA